MGQAVDLFFRWLEINNAVKTNDNFTSLLRNEISIANACKEERQRSQLGVNSREINRRTLLPYLADRDRASDLDSVKFLVLIL